MDKSLGLRFWRSGADLVKAGQSACGGGNISFGLPFSLLALGLI